MLLRVGGIGLGKKKQLESAVSRSILYAKPSLGFDSFIAAAGSRLLLAQIRG
jgi:hypothetical protein